MGKRIYIISDLEGVAGIVSRDQLGPEGSEYEIARSYLTHEVNAAIDGCIEAGASDITVLDGHGHPRGYNIDLAIADDRAEYVIGTHRSSTLPFLNESIDAVFLIGYHAMAGAERAVWSHTQSWESIVSYSINGEEFGEIGQMAIIAGTFEVPVVLVTGDQAAINEAKSVIPGIIGIVVKEGDSRFCARTVTPNRSQTLIKSGAVEATKLIDKISPVRIDFPCEIKITVSDSDFADEMERSGMLRTGKLTLSKTGQSFRDIP
jgi:D-amino peptidase|tara:strand:+ start:57 stop:842 length:786 start_codon:yes stop_codon:yes gene_type:complete